MDEELSAPDLYFIEARVSVHCSCSVSMVVVGVEVSGFFGGFDSCTVTGDEGPEILGVFLLVGSWVDGEAALFPKGWSAFLAGRLETTGVVVVEGFWSE